MTPPNSYFELLTILLERYNLSLDEALNLPISQALKFYEIHTKNIDAQKTIDIQLSKIIALLTNTQAVEHLTMLDEVEKKALLLEINLSKI